MIKLGENHMSYLLSARRLVSCCLLLGVTATLVRGQNDYLPQGGEYPIIGTLPSDQVFPSVSVSGSGGYVVWQDYVTDGNGWGVSARKLDGTLSGTVSAFAVNQTAVGDQEQARVVLLKNGGAAFVWQSGNVSYQHIIGRFLSAAGTWVTNEFMVNASTNKYQQNPAIAVLTNGTSVVVYGSYNQAGTNTLQDVYAQRLSATGLKLGSEFRVNQFINYNQRTPAVAGLADGRFVAVWVSEQQRFENSVDIYARFFNLSGVALGNEFLVSTNSNICANPSVAVAADGTFAIAWSERDLTSTSNSWDVCARVFSSSGVGGPTRRVNSFTTGYQYAPQISADGPSGTGYMIVWTSVGQDGSREGVYGRFMNWNGTFSGDEFRVNTTSVSQQMQPALASDGNGRFLSVWTTFVGSTGKFDLYGQRYNTTIQPLTAPDAPFVTVLSSNALSVSWPPVAGFNVAYYEIYADGASSPSVVVTNTHWTMSGLASASTHTFRFDYVLTDARRSPLSGITTNTTYSSLSWGGIPFEWMITYFGNDIFTWPSPNSDTDLDGSSALQEFLAGTVPTNSASVLVQHLDSTPQGLFLKWNTEPGLMYQVISSSDMATWINLGEPRFAAGHLDSVYVGGSPVGYYRVIRLR